MSRQAILAFLIHVFMAETMKSEGVAGKVEMGGSTLRSDRTIYGVAVNEDRFFC